ncbi:ribonuclease P protein component [Micrococcus luteus]
MLPRDRRVRTAADFRHIRRTGARAGRRSLVVTATADPNDTRSAGPSSPRHPRAGFVVSKAVGVAVVRNRVKRRLRAIMAEQMRQPLLQGRPLLIQVRALPAAAEADYATLEKDLAGALRQAVRRCTADGAA